MERRWSGNARRLSQVDRAQIERLIHGGETAMRLVVLIGALVVVLVPVATAQPLRERSRAAHEECKAEARRVLSREAAELTDALVPPRKKRNVRPESSAVRGVRGLWIGEALLGTTGQVHQVWLVQGVQENADVAIRDAVLKWEYEPLKVGGDAVPLCFGVTVTLK